MLPYVSLYEYVHKQIEHAIDNVDEQYRIYNEYKNIFTSPQLTDQVFIEVMNNYFYEVGLLNTNIKSLKEPAQQVGIKVRATKDALVVTEVLDDIRFVVGDEIVALSGDPIAFCRKRYNRLLGDEPYHREEWGHILTFQNEVDVKRGNQNYHFELKKYPLNSDHIVNVYTRDGVPIVEFVGNITFEQAVEALYHLSKVQHESKKITFDFRGAKFDKLSIAEFLMPYFYEIGTQECILTRDTHVVIEHERHKSLYKHKLERLFKQCEEMNEQAFYQNLIDQPYGDWKYFDENKIDFIGLSRFENITVLIDKDTENAAEWLVYKVANSGIVNLVGRPTKGNLSFFNLVEEVIDQRFVLTFPIANMNKVIKDEVVYPEVLIEWSKRHAIVDKDIKFSIDNSS
ncbi:hypothetical protein [Mammaliicoccus vitulinus]|uniref:hypothetical protein n=1 Tax=Mammaliicoccus vitulinus TaxID=71237 RepID=UPI000D1D3DC8|nr:hypothetical protein [Mammaliicoccus vitulinus]PTI89049.1 hypothetical protein BU071_07855 [Mammaliicoccus vitulinus]QQT15965.1 hypothetical protein I6J10_03230 [Mammaliicoccus vitulinus]QQY18737.1 hypothetical protein I6J11_08565 [Mammaliicoccus vitulinus]RTX83697.1 hypothetical protein CD108_11970 [Mammaliicoccus vitulinus]GGH99474.1 hypothetical protein GCM10007366_07170 [Mammaliicoccus vitulinus]